MKGVFVGLTTLDSVYLVDQLPGADEKCVARDFAMNAGGPATNAAVTFAYLGGRPCLVSAIGTSPAAALVHADLARHRIRHLELVPEQTAGDPAGGAGGAGQHLGQVGAPHLPPGTRASGIRAKYGPPATTGAVMRAKVTGTGHPGAVENGGLVVPGQAGSFGRGRAAAANTAVTGDGGVAGTVGNGPASPGSSFALPMSAVMVTSVTGERAVASTHGMVPRCTANTAAAAAVADADVVLVDGHQVDAAIGLLRSLRRGGPPVLLDGGSWKPGTERILPLVDVVICSTAFRPPGFDPGADILDLLLHYGPFFVAVTDGPGPIRWATKDRRGYVLPPVVTARDTLGAGDIFHGAFAWMVAHGAIATDELVSSLGEASRVAARSVQTFGPRSWMT
ncbi:pfkB family carbohydrate kinase [Parafrankia irregularis]|uniref:PfkB family carbohydrate kinase n=1 Tax=Parafrankia irregularis TaxID=795642 RepID=A0A0S4QGQ5_9ACTN|nr:MULTISPECIES: PfkB family carbohydrate kinase [Parafrankia]MBE3202931.1 carbohydrate kinase [Parafrankia sp. CH37]CUU54441.1 pfkB family carbohydrate kinase [Parafrankia irregularis]